MSRSKVKLAFCLVGHHHIAHVDGEARGEPVPRHLEDLAGGGIGALEHCDHLVDVALLRVALGGAHQRQIVEEQRHVGGRPPQPQPPHRTHRPAQARALVPVPARARARAQVLAQARALVPVPARVQAPPQPPVLAPHPRRRHRNWRPAILRRPRPMRASRFSTWCPPSGCRRTGCCAGPRSKTQYTQLPGWLPGRP